MVIESMFSYVMDSLQSVLFCLYQRLHLPGVLFQDLCHVTLNRFRRQEELPLNHLKRNNRIILHSNTPRRSLISQAFYGLGLN